MKNQLQKSEGAYMKKRRQELSAMNVMLCIFVVMIHILSYPIAVFSPGTDSHSVLRHDAVLIPSQLISFAVQGFVLLSGLKLFLDDRDDIKYLRYLKKRFFSVVLPYLICFTIYYIYFIIIYAYPVNNAGFILKHIFCGSLVYHLYFIPLIVQFDLLLPLWRKIVHGISPILVIPAAIFAGAFFEIYLPSLIEVFTDKPLAIMNDRIFTTYIGFWLTGCYIGKYYDEFAELCRKNFGIITSVFSASAAILALFSHFAYNWICAVPALNNIKYFYCISAILFFLALYLMLPEDSLGKIPIVKLIDRHSYGIYLIHVLLLIVTDRFVIEKYAVQNQLLAFILRFVAAYAGTVIVLCIVSFAKKLPAAPFKRRS